MKFLADENFPRPLIQKIQQLGHSVKTIQQFRLEGSSDETVAQLSLKKKYILLTWDKDFLKSSNLQLLIVVFDFPKITTKEISLLIEKFLITLEKYQTQKQTFKFQKTGLKSL